MPHPSIKPVAASTTIRVLLHSDPGVGKTSFIGTGGRAFKTLLIRPPVDNADPILGSGVEEWVTHDWTEMFEALEYLRHEGKEWEWVWLDSISLWQDVGLDDIWAQTLDRKPSRLEFGLDKLEYGINMERLQQWVRHVSGSGQFNFGITAHSVDLMDPTSEDGGFMRVPWIQGKGMISKIAGYMNVVGYMEVRTREIRGETKPVRVMHTQKSERYYAKNQFNAFPPNGRLSNPTMPKFVEGIEEERAKRKASTNARRTTRRTNSRRATK